MFKPFKPHVKSLGLCLLLATAPNCLYAKTYRWVDEQGKTHFSDVIPPDQAKYERETLNKAAQVTDVTEKAKSKEEYEQEQHMQALRQEQEQLIEKQRAEDRVLLSTYRSVEDMELTLAGRMQALDAQRRVVESNLKRLEHQLEAQQKKAAELERNSQAVPPGLLKDIRASEQQIQQAKDEINTHINKKSQIRLEFEANIERFKTLTKNQDATSTTASSSIALAGLFNCADSAQCDKAWSHIPAFIKRHSVLPIANTTEQLILTKDPATEKEISLSVSRMQTEAGQQKLFLDVRCYHSRLGAELCASKKAGDIRMAFKPFLEAAVK